MRCTALKRISRKKIFLLEIEGTAIPTKVFIDDNDYKIWGFRFYNQDIRSVEFAENMARLQFFLSAQSLVVFGNYTVQKRSIENETVYLS